MNKRYCIDTNVLIQAWNHYYSPNFCPDYWAVLSELGVRKIIFLNEQVAKEIDKIDDDLSRWLKNSKIPIINSNANVTEKVTEIFSFHSSHTHLIAAKNQRSLADPWVIAHAMCESATVVTKESKDLSGQPKNIKIPNVCENMNVRCINDFQFIRELDIRFSCKL
jgi:hypothetical protein